MARPTLWDFKQRQNLEFLLKEGYRLREISKMMQISVPSLLTEIRRGLDGEDAKSGRYVKYRPEVALRAVAVEALGEEGLIALMRYEDGKSKG